MVMTFFDKLYSFILVLMTLTLVPGHRGVGKVKMQLVFSQNVVILASLKCVAQDHTRTALCDFDVNLREIIDAFLD